MKPKQLLNDTKIDIRYIEAFNEIMQDALRMKLYTSIRHINAFKSYLKKISIRIQNSNGRS